MINFDSGIDSLRGVGKTKSEQLKKAGIKTVRDLICYFPKRYENWGDIVKIKDAPLGENVCIKAFVGGPVRERYIRKGMTTYTADITDGESVISVIFFNNKFLPRLLKQDQEYLFFGKLNKLNDYFISMSSPQFLPIKKSIDMRPVYHQFEGFSSFQIEKLIKLAFECVEPEEEFLPGFIVEKYNLMSNREALYNMHFPSSESALCSARKRIGFEELLLLQIGLLRLKSKNKKSVDVPVIRDFSEAFFDLLSFTPTGAQLRAIKSCVDDMTSGCSMNRMIQGDVGSGKTIVCAAAIFNAIRSGYQAVLMVPTEVLARQHYNSFLELFDKANVTVGLLTGSLKQSEKKQIKEKLKSGQIDLIIGTHALIQDDVVFSNLGIAVTDEQHRFGVNQRALLSSKGSNPHILVMSATPIPRTLSHIIYGDLDLSVIDEMPAGRQKIDTFLIDYTVRERAYEYVKKHLIDGFQGYIICPLVENENEEESENELASSVKIFKEFSDGFFKGFKLGLLHGQMSAAEKKSVMEQFEENIINLLVSTTVIEVGVNVPNAVIMVIENAEMFGLSQLHQLRGRVGRGSQKSTCILISDKKDKDSSERLRIIADETDGFKIADEDLRLRGPGDFFGSRQHGLPDTRLSELISDASIVRQTHAEAENLLSVNPDLSGEDFDLLRKRVNLFFMNAYIND